MRNTPYTKSERRAEAEMDAFLRSVNGPSTHDIMDQLRGLTA